MALAAGSRLGPYEIVAALGAGAMGEVYRARDARLNRDEPSRSYPPHTRPIESGCTASRRRLPQPAGSIIRTF